MKKFKDITPPKYELGQEVIFNRFPWTGHPQKQRGKIGLIEISYNVIDEEWVRYHISWKNFYTEEIEEAEVREHDILEECNE